MVTIYYVGEHQPRGAYDVPEERARRLLKLPAWRETDKQIKEMKSPVEKKKTEGGE